MFYHAANPVELDSIHFATNVVTWARFHLKQKWQMMKAMAEMKREH